MKKLVLYSLILITNNIMAQLSETFDIATFKIPNEYKKEVYDSYVAYTATNKNGGFCIIGLYDVRQKSNSPNENFDTFWNELIVPQYQVKAAPQMTEAIEIDGWQNISGGSNFEFNENQVAIILSTYTLNSYAFNVVYMFNDQKYLDDLDFFSSNLKLEEPISTENNNQQSIVSNKNTTDEGIVGTWFTYKVISNSVYNSYSKQQYTFNDDGTYNFYLKTFDMSWSFMLLTKEKGTYSVSDNKITINPKTCVLEKWSKKDRADQWGKLLSTTPKKLEKVTYTFRKQYFSGIDEWDLILTPPKQTERDGAFASNPSYPNSYLYSIPPSEDYLIELPK